MLGQVQSGGVLQLDAHPWHIGLVVAGEPGGQEQAQPQEGGVHNMQVWRQTPLGQLALLTNSGYERGDDPSQEGCRPGGVGFGKLAEADPDPLGVLRPGKATVLG